MPLYLKDKLVSGTGAPGKSAYDAAKAGGYAGTEEEFNEALAVWADAIPSSEKGAANGVATLGADALLAAAQRPKAGGLYRDDGTTTVEASLADISTTLQNKADTTKKASITLSTDWVGDASPYTQTVTISGTTANSKVDLQPDATDITQMANDGTVALYIVNDNGTLTAYAVGEKPTSALTIQATITEVSA